MASKQRQYECRTNTRGAVNTVSLLVMFLLSIAAFVLGSLYFELRYKNQLLQDEVAELKESQILFMVPDEQAEVMANWMADNPVFVQSFVARARAGELTLMPIGDGSVEQLIQNSITQSNQSAPENSTTVGKSIDNTVLEPSTIESAKLKAVATENRSLHENDSPSVDAVHVTAKIDGQELAENADDKQPKESYTAAEQASNGLAPQTIYSLPDKAKMLNVTEEGVKLISLPHGGIRITTRAIEE
ncbi:hypothetical protein AB4238_15730 [Shewanella sp. 10N.286.45.A1]|uniref:hypothetical protein n=1 Tax=Shewanella sp. 10N.286.45.A1 TaxID=3229694 RepID=UPI00354F8319